MSPSATFFNLPLSSTFCADHEKSLLSLDWALASGIKSSGSVASGVFDSLPFYLVLGRDWHIFCRDSLPSARFLLTSGILEFAPNPPATTPPIQACPMDVDPDLHAGFPQRTFLCSPLGPSNSVLGRFIRSLCLLRAIGLQLRLILSCLTLSYA
ncbi:hypothetical protein B0H13DRAFT_2305958 [Mycena leptocephala]|nr:hypothetical protein B0H13DRAFT_2305958 [Mycena leptocephala]